MIKPDPPHPRRWKLTRFFTQEILVADELTRAEAEEMMARDRLSYPIARYRIEVMDEYVDESAR